MKQKNIKEKIAEYFFIHPTEKLRVRQMENVLRIPLPSVIRYCKDLETEGILKIIRIGNVTLYTADRTNENFLLEKKLFNIRQLYKTGFVGFLRQEFHNPPIILFGSYARGEDTEGSDIDVYLETREKKECRTDKFEKMLHRRIQVFRHKHIRDVRNPHLANNILNGATLNGFVEVFT